MTLVPGAFKLLFPRSAVPYGIHTRVRSHLGHPFHLLPLSVTLDKISSAEYVSSAESKARGAGVDIGLAIEFRREPSVERNLHQKVERQRSDDDTGFDHRRPQSGSPGAARVSRVGPGSGGRWGGRKRRRGRKARAAFRARRGADGLAHAGDGWHRSDEGDPPRA